MMHPLLSLFVSPVAHPVFEPGTPKDLTYAALKRLGGRASTSELASESGCTVAQVQHAVRYMLAHGHLTAKETPHGSGRSFVYCLPGNPEPRQGTLLHRILSELSERGPSSAKVLAASLDVPERRLQVVLSYAYKNHKSPGFTREKVAGVMIYTKLEN